MQSAVVHRTWRFLTRITPRFLQNPIRCTAIAILGPIGFATRSGFFRSAFRLAPLGRDGKPIPWYSYPCIDFLKFRRFDDKRVLEFGGGNSTLWWASRCKEVVTLEGNKEWFERIKDKMPGNVDLRYVPEISRESNAAEVAIALQSHAPASFDVVVIDGLYREEMIPIAIKYLATDGAIICDDSQGYEFYERFRGSAFLRVDFFGGQPCGAFAHATSIYFKPVCFLMRDDWPIPDVTRD